MNNYKGVIIEESLEDKAILQTTLQKVPILSTEVETVTERFGTPWLTKWTLHTVEVSEGDIEVVAQLIAKSLDATHKTAWYADFKNEAFHYIVFKDKVFKVGRESRKQYGEAWEYGASLGIPQHQIVQYPGVSMKTIGAFLNAANKSTYTNASAAKAASLRPKSDDYHYEEGDLVYHDTFFGSRDFIGEKIIYHLDRPVWGANYFSSLLDDDISESTLAVFLRKALMQEYENEVPVRGPKSFADGEWEYRFQADGTLARFSGLEEIMYQSKLVYELHIHGGFIG
jgi:hypothetical protein